MAGYLADRIMTFHSPFPTDRLTTHRSYLPVYEKLFKPLQETTDAILEVGVNGGGGLLLWRNYFTNAQIFGIDLSPCPEIIKDHPSIHHIQGDAYDPSITKMLGERTFSIVIDDGSHFPGDQVKFVINYAPLISDEGLLIVEDVQMSDTIPMLVMALPENYNHMIADLRTVNKRYDDQLFIAWRK